MKQTPQWSSLSIKAVLEQLNTSDVKGLSNTDVRDRFEHYGPNVFAEEISETTFARVLKQLKDPLVMILVIAGVVMLFLHEYVDALVVGVAVCINIVIGVFQEERAGKAFAKLAASQQHYANVLRGGSKQRVAVEDLVPGDVVELATGSYVPADIRLLKVDELTLNEAILTGEWAPVEKNHVQLGHDVPLAEQSNMAWMGTLVATGTGGGVVVATGGRTELGSVAESLADAEEVLTPVQKSIKRLARFLTIVVSIIITVVFILGLIRGESVGTMLILAIAVAVSITPAGLPAAVTAVLAIGMEKILHRGGLVRNLLAAETLGSTTTILTDKTGTLTQAQMQLATVITRVDTTNQTVDDTTPDAFALLGMAVLSSDAFIETNDDTGAIQVQGRPVERAIVEGGLRAGIDQRDLTAASPRLDFLPFSSEQRFAASLNEEEAGGAAMMYITGAPEALLEKATMVLKEGTSVRITKADRQYFLEQYEALADQGMRFIAVGYRKAKRKTFPEDMTSATVDTVIEKLTFGGLIGLNDPIREDVPESIARARRAGARVIMLTGDNPETAGSIAHAAGIVRNPDPETLRGSDVEELDDDALLEKLRTVRVFARMRPKQKMRIAKLLQRHGEVVAMTGDGVNDAPALKNADIGVAVGSGTEVAQEASDLVLLNNSFSVIVAAIEEGRRIIDNLKKVVAHLLSTSFGEVFVIAAAFVFGLPLPILAIQVLWLNIIEGGVLNFAFAFEPVEAGVMRRNPHEQRAREILTPAVRRLILLAGTATGVLMVGLFAFLHGLEMPIDEIRTIIFIALTLDAIFFAFSIKNFHKPIWKINPLSNQFLIVALGISFLLLVLTLTVPALRTLLSLTSLSGFAFIVLVGVAIIDVAIIETVKYLLFDHAHEE